MRRCGRIHDFPTVVVVHLALVFGQTAVRIVQDQTGPQRRKSRVDVDRIGITGKIHGMHAVVGKVAAQPFDPLEVRGKPVLHDKVFAKAQDICGIKQRLFFGGDKELLGRPLQPLCIVRRGLGALSCRKFGSSSKYCCIRGR